MFIYAGMCKYVNIAIVYDPLFDAKFYFCFQMCPAAPVAARSDVHSMLVSLQCQYGGHIESRASLKMKQASCKHGHHEIVFSTIT